MATITEKFIGCSGFYYNHWKNLFYPEGLPKDEWLPFYAKQFNTVEINSSFYHMPVNSTLKRWHDITQDSFIFTLKGNRFITHLKKLQADDELKKTLEDFQGKAKILKNKLGCILWQLPKSQKFNPEKLETFSKLLDHNLHHVFEFRDASWFNDSTYKILRQYNITMCTLSAPGDLPESIIITSDVIYLRFHGKGGWYNDNYSDEQLEQWKDKIKASPVKRLYAYFNNDFNAFAVHNGLTFAKLLNQKL